MSPQKTPTKSIFLEEGSLCSLVEKATEHGLQSCALQSITTNYEMIEDSGVLFQVHMLGKRQKKAAAQAIQIAAKEITQPRKNPFLPYEQDLFVADVSNTHLIVLNKYNVLAHHILIITRVFESQETMLSINDFHALFLAMREYKSLAFYNSGKSAGASQAHKHLQLTPLPTLSGGIDPPFSPSIQNLLQAKGKLKTFPFIHAISPCDIDWAGSEAKAASRFYAMYQDLLLAIGCWPQKDDTEKPLPYNLLMTRDWMMLIPRRIEFFQSISINALGFVGSLLVRNAKELALLKKVGPLSLLCHVGIAI